MNILQSSRDDVLDDVFVKYWNSHSKPLSKIHHRSGSKNILFLLDRHYKSSADLEFWDFGESPNAQRRLDWVSYLFYFLNNVQQQLEDSNDEWVNPRVENVSIFFVLIHSSLECFDQCF